MFSELNIREIMVIQAGFFYCLKIFLAKASKFGAFSSIT